MDQNLLDKFFKGECTAKERKSILAWYLSGEADHELSEKIEAYWQEETKKQNDFWGRESLFKSIDEKLDASSKKDKVINHQKKSSPKKLWKGWNYAAVISLLLLSGGWWYYQAAYTQSKYTQNQSGIEPISQELMKQTAKGEKLSFVLEDSTVVKLNSGSRIRYNLASAREVYLEGEAFFEVSRDTLHPFKIHTGSITTTVLGTSFNIKAFAHDEEIAVSVVSGEVKVEQQDSAQERLVHLIPGEQAVYTHTDTVLAKKKFDYQDVLSWKEGRLYFKNARFSEVVQALENWYGVEIEVRRKGIENGFSGAYTNRSLESVLEGMSFVLNFEYEIHDKRILIK